MYVLGRCTNTTNLANTYHENAAPPILSFDASPPVETPGTYSTPNTDQSAAIVLPARRGKDGGLTVNAACKGAGKGAANMARKAQERWCGAHCWRRVQRRCKHGCKGAGKMVDLTAGAACKGATNTAAKAQERLEVYRSAHYPVSGIAIVMSLWHH